MVDHLPGGQKANTKGKGAFLSGCLLAQGWWNSSAGRQTEAQVLEPICEKGTDYCRLSFGLHVHTVAPWHTHTHINTHAHNSVKN